MNGTHMMTLLLSLVLGSPLGALGDFEVRLEGEGGQASVVLRGLSSEAVEGLKLVQGGVTISGFVEAEKPDESLFLSVCTITATTEPPQAVEYKTETGRLEVWAYGILLQRPGALPPLRVGGPLEPFLFRLAGEGRRVVALRGFERSGTFCTVSTDLQPDILP